jgi:hypothetical protein
MQFNLRPLEKHAFPHSELYEIHSSVALPGGLLYRISFKSFSKYGNNAQEFMYTLK